MTTWTRLAALAIAISASPVLADKDMPAVSTKAHMAIRLSDLALSETPVCRTAIPEPWRDASNVRFFATGPTARLDAQELAAGGLAPLIGLRFTGGVLQAVVLGSTIRSGLHFTTSGWRPRWPLC